MSRVRLSVLLIVYAMLVGALLAIVVIAVDGRIYHEPAAPKEAPQNSQPAQPSTAK